MITKWETVENKKVADLFIFDAYIKKRKNPVTNEYGSFTVLQSNNWVNIIPITKDKEIILIEQYRHGTDSITLEIPGGLIENGEAPLSAAKRECTEETGYSSKSDIIQTGVSYPNPAYQSNQCFSFVWFDCEYSIEQKLDRHEIINIHKHTFSEVKSMIENGTINHSVILTAFYYFSIKFGF
ncbi:MAG TPA: NUDIX hydrolase [Candidatus Kapabacteria bacterium]|nr:NUDIX hydrolase [Candidatus Kapabacteria bacterium]